MTQVITLQKQRTVGSLTSEDLGIPITIDNFTVVTPVSIAHMVDASSGDMYTEIRDETSPYFPEVHESDSVFRVIDDD